MPLSYSLDHVGPLARTAEDLALMLQAIAGHDPDDPTTSCAAGADYRASSAVDGVRAAARRGAGRAGCAESSRRSRRSVEAAAGVLADGGHARAAPSTCRPSTAINALRRVGHAGRVRGLPPRAGGRRRDGYNPQTLARMEPGFQFSGVDYVRALAARAPLLRPFCAEVFADADILALPTCPVTTPGIAETDTGGDARFTAVANRLGTLVGPFNYSGLPALSLPVGFDCAGHAARAAAGGRPFGEALLLRAAHAFEEIAGIARPAAAARRPSLRPWSRPPPRRRRTRPSCAASCSRSWPC